MNKKSYDKKIQIILTVIQLSIMTVYQPQIIRFNFLMISKKVK